MRRVSYLLRIQVLTALSLVWVSGSSARAADSDILVQFCSRYSFVCVDPDFKRKGVDPFVSAIHHFSDMNGFNANFFWNGLSQEKSGLFFATLKPLIMNAADPEELAFDFGKWISNYIGESLPTDTPKQTLRMRAEAMGSILGELSRTEVLTLAEFMHPLGLWMQLSKNDVDELPKYIKALQNLERAMNKSRLKKFLEALDGDALSRLATRTERKSLERLVEDWGIEYVEYLSGLRYCKKLLETDP